MKQIISLVLAMAAMSVLAQSNVSAPMDFHIEGDVMPAVLNIVPGTFQFVDQDTNNVINPNEQCKIRFQVINYGSGDGYGCVAHTEFSGSTEGISISDVPLPVVLAGNKRWVEIPILVGSDIETGELALDIAVDEPHGFGTDKIQFKIPTYQPKAPIAEAWSGARGGVGCGDRTKFGSSSRGVGRYRSRGVTIGFARSTARGVVERCGC